MQTFDWYKGDKGTVVADATDEDGELIDLEPSTHTIYFIILDEFSDNSTTLVSKNSSDSDQMEISGDDNETFTVKFVSDDFDDIDPQWLAWALIKKNNATFDIKTLMRGYFKLQPDLYSGT